MWRWMAAALVLVMGASASAEQPKREEAEKSAEPRDKLLCKRFTETGSLVAKTRVCKTKADWDRDRDNIRQNSGGATCRLAGNGAACTY
ncbi:hypothetical protein ACFOKI_09190 [Sphingomonas qilianensis]|uniref:DUF3011 domain-containing protein n=1 Tax=Sphingomonas qilianensis TaxID=1736690 RepID=A0ABU9XTN5_9SPHN